MRLSIVLFALICVFAVVIGAVPITQDQEDVRGAFLTSRPKEKTENSNTGAKPVRRKPKTAAVATTPTTTTPKTTPSGRPTPVQPEDDLKSPRVGEQRLGLGLTLFIRDSNGLAVRVDPTHVFHQGDRVRVLLETNSNGYLYIFNTTDGGPPVMVYPDPELDEAGNYLQSHIPFEIPSSSAPEERLRWLAFDEHPGNERLIFMFTREPLAGIPIDDALISYCRDAKPSCPWRPPAAAWVQIQQQLAQPVQTDRVERYGKAQTDVEQKATTRGIGLAKDDPQPSLIMMLASSKGSTLVTALDLFHK
jgi:hypothetical protein